MPIRVAYFDCFSGISGDMILGALLDAGLELDRLREALADLPLEGYTLTAHPAMKGAIGATAATVELTREESTHRHLVDVLEIIDRSTLDSYVKERAVQVFHRLAAAEARVHRVGVEAIHFHEVGAVDAIVDVVGSVAGLHLLGIDDVFCSPLPMTHGWSAMDHGVLPLPAPAVLELLAGAGLPTIPYAGPERMELVTPTGAALLATLAQPGWPAMSAVRQVGYGAGRRELTRPNLLRVIIGDKAPHYEREYTPHTHRHEHKHNHPHEHT